MKRELKDNYYVQDQINYTTSEKTREWWKMRYEFALQYVKKNFTVLDCACGLGENTNMLAEHCKKAVGMDIDNKYIEYCKDKWHAVEFHNCDITKEAPFPDNYFDIVISVETLEHLPTEKMLDRALKNFHRLVKPSGIFLMTGPHEHRVKKNMMVHFKIWLLKWFGNQINPQARWHEHYFEWTPNKIYKKLDSLYDTIEIFGQAPGGISREISIADHLIACAKKPKKN